MSRKDYELIARAVKARADLANVLQTRAFRLTILAELVSTLSAELKRDNPRFDSERFALACGVESHV